MGKMDRRECAKSGIHHRDTTRRSRNHIVLVLVVVLVLDAVGKVPAHSKLMRNAVRLAHGFAKGFAFLERIQPGKEMLVGIMAMLTKLVERFDPDQYRVGASGLTASFESEDDHEDELKILAKKQHFDRL